MLTERRMNPNDAAAVLERLARRAWWMQALRLSVFVLAVVLPLTLGLGVLEGWSVGGQVLVGMGLLGGGIGLSLVWLRRKGIDAHLMAAHLDRTTPALEESAALLLRPADDLRLVERMQQQRALDAFSHLLEPPRVPGKGLRLAGAFLGFSLVLSLAVAVWMPQPFTGAGTTSEPVLLHAVGVDSLGGQTPVEVEKAQVTLTPPSYSRVSPVISPDLTLEALQNTRAVWTITLNQPAERATIHFSDGDTLALRLNDAGVYEAARTLRYAGFYYLEFVASTQRRYRSDYYALSIIEDLPPVLTVVQPEPRTVIEPGEPAAAAVKVLADDDYGLRDMRLVATVAKGTGENVKFREQALDFDRSTRTSSTSWTLETTLDLAAMGMEMGDELFFFVEGWDNRAPEPNRGRSETIFVVLRDTSQWAAPPSLSLALDAPEEYLRSQRQIIIDTEKLIADKPGLAEDTFQRRSNAIGIDQKLLRLRYGQFLGEEFESTVTEAERFIPGLEEDDHADEHAGETAFDSSPDAAREIIEQYAHMHDAEEAATFYSEDIKQELKAALAEMWDAELHLRMFRPEEALPYEYRALRILKALQQKSRIYVKRIGFEPPPIKPEEARLTGNLDEVPSHKTQQDVRADVSFPAIREALTVLQQAPDEKEAVVVLERAAQELAGVVVEEAGRYLAALQDLRTLIDDLDAGRGWCRACVGTVRRALWNVLPPAQAAPAPRREGTSSLSRRYFNQLGQ